MVFQNPTPLVVEEVVVVGEEAGEEVCSFLCLLYAAKFCQ
jgi:hypothetical protein